MIFTAFILTCSVMVMGLFDLLKVKRAELLLQQITDAAVLIAKRSEASILTTKGITAQTEARTTGESRAKSYVSEQLTKHDNLFGTQTQVPTFIWDNVTGDLQMKMKTPLNSLFNKQYFPEAFYTVSVQAKAEMNVGIATEIALVLDNSRSMFMNDTRPTTDTRFKLLRTATLSFVDNIFDAALTSNNPDAVRVSVIPWSFTVNIRSEAPAVKDYAKYTYTIPSDKGTQTEVTNPMSRSGPNNPNDYNPVGWRGCIVNSGSESTTNYTDTQVSSWGTFHTAPSGNQSFTGYATNAAGTACTNKVVSGKICATSGWEKNDTCYEQKTIYSGWGAQTCYKLKTNAACTVDYNEPTNKVGSTTGKWCSWEPKQEWKNLGNGDTPPEYGPNIYCPAPMLGLSANRKQVIDTINRMSPSGGTHQDLGLRWGLRSLSPNNGWPAFFGLQGNEKPKAFKSDVEKVLILITDGENANPDFGFWKNNYPVDLDAMTLGWCNAIRNTYGIKIYTVALNVTNTTAKNLLKSCVGSANPERAFTVDAANLQDALKTIGRSLKSLKLTM